MRRILLWSMSTLSAVVLLFSYKTSTHSSNAAVLPETSAEAPIVGGSAPTTGTTPSTASSARSSSSGDSSSSSAATSTPAAPSAATDPSSATAAPTTVTGSVAQTRWGPVQVQLTVDNGKITQVSVLQYPDGNGKDQQINARALPVLISETVSAQNADIDMVSGATVTSQGYLTSLQSALDQAGL